MLSFAKSTQLRLLPSTSASFSPVPPSAANFAKFRQLPPSPVQFLSVSSCCSSVFPPLSRSTFVLILLRIDLNAMAIILQKLFRCQTSCRPSCPKEDYSRVNLFSLNDVRLQIVRVCRYRGGTAMFCRHCVEVHVTGITIFCKDSVGTAVSCRDSIGTAESCRAVQE